MMCTKITFDKLLEAVAYLIQSVSELKTLIEEKELTPTEKRLPIGIDEASRIIQKAKPTIYALVRKGVLPSYKRGKKLFFFEDELIEWIAKGKRKTVDEIRAEMATEIYLKPKKR